LIVLFLKDTCILKILSFLLVPINSLLLFDLFLRTITNLIKNVVLVVRIHPFFFYYFLLNSHFFLCITDFIEYVLLIILMQILFLAYFLFLNLISVISARYFFKNILKSDLLDYWLIIKDLFDLLEKILFFDHLDLLDLENPLRYPLGLFSPAIKERLERSSSSLIAIEHFFIYTVNVIDSFFSFIKYRTHDPLSIVVHKHGQ